MSARRFDSQEYLDQWAQRRWPDIHSEVFSLIRRRPPRGPVLDLCCSTGLLAQRIVTLLGVPAVGVDGDEPALNAARAAGVTVPLVHLPITIGTLPRLVEVLAEHAVTGVIARRCLPELLGRTGTLDVEFRDALLATFASAGVAQLWLQGRVPTKRATNALPTIAEEVNAMALAYVPAGLTRSCAYLEVIE